MFLPFSHDMILAYPPCYVMGKCFFKQMEEIMDNDSLKTKCTHCGQTYEVEKSMFGTVAECLNCGCSFVVSATANLDEAMEQSKPRLDEGDIQYENMPESFMPASLNTPDEEEERPQPEIKETSETAHNAQEINPEKKSEQKDMPKIKKKKGRAGLILKHYALSLYMLWFLMYAIAAAALIGGIKLDRQKAARLSTWIKSDDYLKAEEYRYYGDMIPHLQYKAQLNIKKKIVRAQYLIEQNTMEIKRELVLQKYKSRASAYFIVAAILFTGASLGIGRTANKN